MKPDVYSITSYMMCFILARYCRWDGHFCDIWSVSIFQKGNLGKKWSDSIIYKGVSQETSPKHTVSKRQAVAPALFLQNTVAY